MWLNNEDTKVNPHATITVDGTTYYGNILQFPAVIAALGWHEINEDVLYPKPVDYDPDFYIRTDQDIAPHVIYTRHNEALIDSVLLSRAKATREQQVANIVVTTLSGKTFDGDEVSQNRMARAITALDPLETTLWVLADNTPDPTVTREELREALRLAGAAQTAVWAAPYQS